MSGEGRGSGAGSVRRLGYRGRGNLNSVLCVFVSDLISILSFEKTEDMREHYGVLNTG